jgi:competence protein ComEC
MHQQLFSVKNLLVFCAGISLAVLPTGIRLSGFPPFLLFSLPGLILLGICLSAAFRNTRYVFPCLLFLSGFLWGLQTADKTTSRLLNAELDDEQFIVEGSITGLPRLIESFGRSGQQFDVEIHHFYCVNPSPACELLQLQLVRVRWMKGEEVRAGEKWRFVAELRRPRGLANPAGRDYEVWLVQQGISATGKVLEGQRIAEANNFVAWRETLTKSLRQHLKHHRHAGILEALINGNNAAIDSSLWELFADTNTTHLFVISGLHLSLMGGLCWWFLRRLFSVFWQGSPFATSMIAAFIAWICAALYALLAGWAIPVQRALALFTLILFIFLLRRSLQPLQSLVLLLAVCLCLDPLCLLSMSFWLSWSAASVLLLGLTGRKRQPAYGLWVRSQWIITCGLAPILIASVGQISLLGFFANLIAIPIINLIVVPLNLFALLVASFSVLFASGIWFLLDNFLYVLLQVLKLLVKHGKFLIWNPVTAIFPLVLLCVAAGIFLLPKALPARMVALLCALPIMFFSPPQLPDDELHLTVFDVGQGLAVLAQVSDKVLLYDTGPRLGETTDAAKTVILPFLYRQGIRQIDTLVISHGDMDHAGGLKSLSESFRIREIISGDLLPIERPDIERSNIKRPDIESKLCDATVSWQWQAFGFEFIHPESSGIFANHKSNNRSCVLRIYKNDTSRESALVLLPGDIEKKIEYELLRQNRSILPSEVILMPHHGSRSSSSPAFVKAVGPQIAIASSGYRHRFGHPHADIVRRYQDNNAVVLNTADAGAISLVWRQGSWQIVDLNRQRRSYFWQ